PGISFVAHSFCRRHSSRGPVSSTARTAKLFLRAKPLLGSNQKSALALRCDHNRTLVGLYFGHLYAQRGIKVGCAGRLLRTGWTTVGTARTPMCRQGNRATPQYTLRPTLVLERSQTILLSICLNHST